MRVPGAGSASRLHGLMKRPVSVCSVMLLAYAICCCLSSGYLLSVHCLCAVFMEANKCKHVSKI